MVVFHQLYAFIVEKNTVLDGVHVGAHSIFDRDGRMCVRGNLASQTMRLRNQGFHFCGAVLLESRIVALGKDSAGSAELDYIRSVLDGFADLVHYGLDTVRGAFR